ncbi:cytochrome c oxidase assembly protein [Alienimonas californiensis]|uniref:Cytochrome c oxidase caa3 assembly factor (Caa3_CtaG) n=1 Tax=Alienimonas californiensis TaxID=2527989 RepID=A0A517PA11_9PLAN|nr:cytochrome c oxidase assembly protein [Alienimonas californiensis]QDT16216.1 Cytochrome c oxidase caa3 assembly factor (Caa3_CtaG) [Alienimonas californiensis]
MKAARTKSPLLIVAGLGALAAAWIGPLPRAAEGAFTAHMSMHMLNVAIAAPLLALGLAGTRCDPTPAAPWLFAVIPASIAELLIVWAWHAPAPHHLARTGALGLVAEQGTFLLSGLWVWLSAFGGGAAFGGRTGGETRDRGRSAAGVIGLLLTSMHMTLLGALLALAPRAVYPHHDGFDLPGWGPLTALQDQHLGGAVMLVIGGAAYLAGGLALATDLLSPPSSPATPPPA